MAKHFRVSFDIPESKLTTVVGLISGEVGNLVIRDTATINTGSTPLIPVKHQRQGSGRKSEKNGKTAMGAVHNALSEYKVGTEVPYAKVTDVLVAAGYNASSHTSMISQMVFHGYIERTKAQHFRILKAFKKEA